MPGPTTQNIERRFIRHPSRIPISFDLQDDPDQHRDCLRNVSDGGVCFSTSRRITPGLPIRLHIPVFGEQFEVQGNVAWCREASRSYEVGVAFGRVQDRFAIRMIEQLCYIEDYRVQVEREEGRTLTSEQAAAEWVKRFAGQFPK